MKTLHVQLELPRDLLGALDIPEDRLPDELRELIAVELFREGRISSGKGAELIGISKKDFVQVLARRGIPYFTETPDELSREVDAVTQ